MTKENPLRKEGINIDKAKALENLARDIKILSFREEAEQRSRIETGPELVDVPAEIRGLIEEGDQQKLIADVEEGAEIFMHPPSKESDPSRYLDALIRLRTFYPEKEKEFRINDAQWRKGMEYLDVRAKEAEESDRPAYTLSYLALADRLNTIDPNRFQSVKIPGSILEKTIRILKEDTEDTRGGDMIATGDFMERYTEAQNFWGQEIQEEIPIDETLLNSIRHLIQNAKTYIEQGALISLASKMSAGAASEVTIPRELWDGIREELFAYGIVGRKQMERIHEPIAHLMDLKVESKSDYLKRIKEQTNIQ